MPNNPAQTTQGQMQQQQMDAQRQQQEAQQAEMQQMQAQQAQRQAMEKERKKKQEEDDPINRNARAKLGKGSRMLWQNIFTTWGATFIVIIIQFFTTYLFGVKKSPKFGYFLDRLAGQKMSPTKEPSKAAEIGEIIFLLQY